MPKKFGKYLLIRRIAVGGMAEVYLGKVLGAEGFQRTVVVKKILSSYSEDESFITMFIDEARIAAALHHANIVQVYDFDKVGDSYYIAMEYVEGRDLRKTIDTAHRRDKLIPIPMAAHIAAEVAAGLYYAHTKTDEEGRPVNIIHRDVSPHNILLSFTGEVKIGDFGIAKAAARSTKTRAGTVKGKCAYMSPEQAKGGELDHRSDIFALGAVLWEMLVGKRAFDGDTDFEILSSVVNKDVPPPSLFRPEVPRQLDAIVLKALRKPPNERHPDMDAFRRDLQGFVFKHVASMDDIAVGKYLKALFAEEIAREPTRKVEVVPETEPPSTAEKRRQTGPGQQAARDSQSDVNKTLALPESHEEVPPTVPVASLQQELEGMIASGEVKPASDSSEATVALPEGTGQGAAQGPSTGTRTPVAAQRLQTGTGMPATPKRKGFPWVAAVVGSVALAAIVAGAAFYVSGGSGEGGSDEHSVVEPDARVEEPSPLAGLKEPERHDKTDIPHGQATATNRLDSGELAKPSPEKATLVFRVSPANARVLVDGKPLPGDSVRVFTKAWVGDEIEIKASHKGYLAFSSTLHVEKDSQQVDVRLRPKRRKRHHQASRETGFVTINARPWANVYYKGRKIGTTPVRKFKVPVGWQKFVLKNRTATRVIKVKVEKDKTTRKVVDM